MQKAKKVIQKYKNIHFPRLTQVNGLLAAGVIAFSIFNLILGASLFTQVGRTTDFFIINDVFTHQVWGTTFFIGGVSLLLGYIMNWWTQMRYTILFLLFTKFMWMSALIVRQIQDPSTNILLLLFFTLATALQVAGYFYFPIYRKIETWKV